MTTPTKTEKAFDCVEFKRHAQLKIYEDIQGMTHEQERAYFERQAECGPIADWWKRIKAAERTGINRNTLHKKLKECELEK
jgi:transcriptional regulator of acetoin/glycerol metabolism